MKKAKDITSDEIRDITNLSSSDPLLYVIKNHKFKCPNPECDAKLILCSIEDTNFVIPHFKLSNSRHVRNCYAENDKKEGLNKASLSKNGINSFYNEVNNIVNNKFAPVIFRENIDFSEKITYKINFLDVNERYFNIDSSNNKWLNLNNLGIKIPNQSILNKRDNINGLEIIIFVNRIIKSNNSGRNYSNDFWWIIKEGAKVIEKYINKTFKY